MNNSKTGKDEDSSKIMVLHTSKTKTEFSLSGRTVIIDVLFSVECNMKLCEYYKQSKNYRDSFAKVAYVMYLRTKSETESSSFSEDDFINATDRELRQILEIILTDDRAIKSEYEKIQNDDCFERFFSANENLWKKELSNFETLHEDFFKSFDIVAYNGFQKQIAEQSEIIQSLRVFPLLSTYGFRALERVISPFNVQYMNIDHIRKALNFDDLSRQFDKMRDVYLRNTEIFRSPIIESIVKKAAKLNSDISKYILPNLLQTDKAMQDAINILEKPFEHLEQLFSKIDFSLLSYSEEWSEKHEVLVKFGWFYLNELPNEIIDDIYNRQATLTSNDVDNIITQYFRRDNFIKLKHIVQKWESSSYFKRRRHIFNQALNTHTYELFNASTTLLALHIEGVITDFMRIKLQEPNKKIKNAIPEIVESLKDIPIVILSFADYKVYSLVLGEILETFTEYFSSANPDSASNNSRHKIAHGHAVDIETEINSLKRFLYMNEMYRLISFLDTNLSDDE